MITGSTLLTLVCGSLPFVIGAGACTPLSYRPTSELLLGSRVILTLPSEGVDLRI
jgi:hypothetical protein